MSKKGGHHGGAWKVAYADFVTAMMALFMVLWLAAQDQKIKEAVERAFRNPFMSVTKGSPGIIETGRQDTAKPGGRGKGSGLNQTEVALLRRLHDQMSMKLLEDHSPDELKEAVQFDLSDEGLRISVFDRSRKPVFESNSAELTRYGNFILSTLAWGISEHSGFAVEVEGHTSTKPETLARDFDSWALSSSRANTARRTLVHFALRPLQVKKVAGFSDTVPLPDREPDDPANRRITVLLRVSESG